jgi:hypothetical protein
MVSSHVPLANQYPRRDAGRKGAYRRRNAMALAPPLPPSPRRAQRPGPGDGAGTGSDAAMKDKKFMPSTSPTGHTHGLSRLVTVSQTGTSAPGWTPPARPDSGGSPGGTGTPSRRRQRRAHRGPAGQIVHPERCSTWPTGPRPASRQAHRRDGIPTPGPSCGKSTPRIRRRFSLCPPRARSQGHHRSITVNPVLCGQVSAGQHFSWP